MTLDALLAAAKAKAPERKYLDWLRTQPSALSGGSDWIDGEAVCDPAHWRTARYSGTGQKPAYLAIPLRHAEHDLQHRHGQGVIGTREWWEKACIEHLERWLAS